MKEKVNVTTIQLHLVYICGKTTIYSVCWTWYFPPPSSFKKLVALFFEGKPSMFHYIHFKRRKAVVTVVRDSGSSHLCSVSITLPMTCHWSLSSRSRLATPAHTVAATSEEQSPYSSSPTCQAAVTGRRRMKTMQRRRRTTRTLNWW